MGGSPGMGPEVTFTMIPPSAGNSGRKVLMASHGAVRFTLSWYRQLSTDISAMGRFISGIRAAALFKRMSTFPKASSCPASQLGYVLVNRYVDANGHAAASCRLDLGPGIHQGRVAVGPRCVAPGADDEVGPEVRPRHRRRLPDAAAGAGDDGDLSTKGQLAPIHSVPFLATFACCCTSEPLVAALFDAGGIATTRIGGVPLTVRPVDPGRALQAVGQETWRYPSSLTKISQADPEAAGPPSGRGRDILRASPFPH